MIRLVTVNKLARIACGCLAVGLLLAGCAASKTISDGPGHSQNSGTICVCEQDLPMTAEAIVTSLLESGVIDRATRHPAVLAISRILNATSQQLDTSLLIKNIEAALLKTGKVVVAAKEHNAVDSSSHADAVARPDFTLSGRVVETRERTGNTSQITYVFSFSLADSNGLTIWAEDKTISKQARRRNPGF